MSSSTGVGSFGCGMQEASNKTSKHKKSIPKNEPSTEEQAKLDMLQRLEEAAKAATARRAARRRGGMAVSELTRGSLSWTDFKLLFSIRCKEWLHSLSTVFWMLISFRSPVLNNHSWSPMELITI